MRKILIVLTLIVSSFFIFNTSVKADTINLNISQTEFNKYFSILATNIGKIFI